MKPIEVAVYLSVPDVRSFLEDPPLISFVTGAGRVRYRDDPQLQEGEFRVELPGFEEVGPTCRASARESLRSAIAQELSRMLALARL